MADATRFRGPFRLRVPARTTHQRSCDGHLLTPHADQPDQRGGPGPVAPERACPRRRGPDARADRGTRPRTRTASAARWVTATAVLVSAVVHLYLWATGMNQADVIGPAFLLNGVGGVVLAIVVVAWRHWLPLLGAVGFGAATLGAFILSRTVGLFGVRETIWSTAAVISAVVEVLAIANTIASWRAERHPA